MDFVEDSQQHPLFSAENHCIFRYDVGNSTQFTSKDGLTANCVQSIMEDDKGQVWFGTWQGISVFGKEKLVMPVK